MSIARDPITRGRLARMRKRAFEDALTMCDQWPFDGDLRWMDDPEATARLARLREDLRAMIAALELQRVMRAP